MKYSNASRTFHGDAGMHILHAGSMGRRGYYGCAYGMVRGFRCAYRHARLIQPWRASWRLTEQLGVLEQARRRIEGCKRSRKGSFAGRGQPGAGRPVRLPRQDRRRWSDRPGGEPVRDAALAFQRGKTGQPFAFVRFLRGRGGFLLAARGFRFVTGATGFFSVRVRGLAAGAMPATATTFDLVAQAGRVPAFCFRPLGVGRRLDLVGPRPGPVLLGTETTALRPALLRRCAAARMVLARKGLAAILGGKIGHREPGCSRHVAAQG